MECGSCSRATHGWDKRPAGEGQPPPARPTHLISGDWMWVWRTAAPSGRWCALRPVESLEVVEGRGVGGGGPRVCPVHPSACNGRARPPGAQSRRSDFKQEVVANSRRSRLSRRRENSAISLLFDRRLPLIAPALLIHAWLALAGWVAWDLGAAAILRACRHLCSIRPIHRRSCASAAMCPSHPPIAAAAARRRLQCSTF